LKEMQTCSVNEVISWPAVGDLVWVVLCIIFAVRNVETNFSQIRAEKPFVSTALQC
jgi:hypothetical protein